MSLGEGPVRLLAFFLFVERMRRTPFAFRSCSKRQEPDVRAVWPLFHAIIGPMNNVFVLLMLMAGAGVAMQIVINAQLRVVAASALWATNISFAVSMVAGLAALAVGTAAGRVPLPAPALWRAPLWVWLGGLGGALYVLLAVLLASRLGAALLSATGILGQLGASIAIDHYGWFGAPVHRVSAGRAIGVVLLAVGVALIRWK